MTMMVTPLMMMTILVQDTCVSICHLPMSLWPINDGYDGYTIDDSCSGYLFWCQPAANVSLTKKSTLDLELSSLLAIRLLLFCRYYHDDDDDGDDDADDDDQGCASVHLMTGLVNLLGNLEELVIRDVAEVTHSICSFNLSSYLRDVAEVNPLNPTPNSNPTHIYT